jgi:H+/Cl- antiporter ClcA
MDREKKLSYIYLIKWVILALIAGIVGSLIVRSFFLLTREISSYLHTFSIPVFLWTVAGALLAGGIIYRIQPHAAGEGIPSYIRGMRIHKGNLPFSVTFFKYWAALATLATFGNGGVVGPLGRVSSGLMSFISRKIGWAFDKHDWHVASICGLAAAVGSIFHSSIGGGIFAVEVIQRAKMGYKDIFPAILASSAAVFICKAVGWNSFYTITVVNEFLDIRMVWGLLFLVICAGAVGGLYIRSYAVIARLWGRKEGNVFLKVILGSFIAGSIGWLINPELLGTSDKMIQAIISGELMVLTGRMAEAIPLFLILFIMLAGKAICNCITVGSGMSAGFTGPAAIIGMLLGAACAHLFNIPPDTATFYALIAAGFSGVLSSSMNIPLAAAIMTVEIFGLHYSFPAALAAVVGFQVTRAKTIYDYALESKELDMD